MSDPQANALLAMIIGTALGLLILIPVAAVLYRRSGRLGLSALVTLFAVAVYGVALWTYTLLPLPDRETFRCVGTQLTPLATWDDIVDRGAGSPRELLANAAFRQVVLNVALFVPLGFFVRRVLRRGVVTAALIGLTVSAAIELTQRSGVWGIYDCAYRVFDVDDLITNTAGAIIGSVLSAVIVTTNPTRKPLPDTVTLGRRWMALACDALATVLVAFALNVGWRAFHLYGPGDDSHLDGAAEQWFAWGGAAGLQLLAVLIAGRTIGEWAVAVQPASRTPQMIWGRRIVKWALGVGCFAVLSATGGPIWPLIAFVAVTVIGTLPGRNHPGLSNAAAGFTLEVSARR